jgi:hypothetical protein
MVKNIVWNRFYLSIFVFLLITYIFFPTGILLMGDWTTPANDLHLDKYFELYTWNGQYYGEENRSIELSVLPFKFFFYNLGKIFPIKYLNFLVFLFAQLVGFYSIYKFLTYLKLDNSTVLIISILYPLNPINYDFIIMGWIYALIAINLMPLAIYFWLKSFRDNSYIFKLILMLLFFSFQSQAFVWLISNILFFTILYFNKILNYKKIILNFFLILVSYFILNFYWILQLFLSDNSYLIISQNLGLAEVSIGQDSKWNIINSSQLLGSTFNAHFQNNLGFLKNFMLIIPVSFLLNIFLNENKKYFIKILFIYISVLLFINLIIENRNLFFQIPFANIFRHISRNLAILILICYLSLSFALEKLLNKKVSFFFISFIILILILPWIYKNSSRGNSESFILKEFITPDYFKTIDKEVDQRFSKNDKILKIPTGLSKKYDYTIKKFNLNYHEINDVFALYSNIPTIINGKIRNYFEKNLLIQDSAKYLNLNGILIHKNYYDFRADEFFFLEKLKKSENFELKIDNINFSLFERKIKIPLLFIRNQSNEYKKLYFHKINPVKINIITTISNDQFLELNFLETFSSNWELNIYLDSKNIDNINYKIEKKFSEFNTHDSIIDFDYSKLKKKYTLKNNGQVNNKFLLDIKKLCTIEKSICEDDKILFMQLKYKLQEYFKFGLSLSLIFFFTVFLIVIFKFDKKNVY